MPRVKQTVPAPSREKFEKNLDLPLYLDRILPVWARPLLYNGDVWRNVVARQPIAANCRDTLVSNILALDWKIEPRDSDQREELKEDIKYHTKLIQNWGDIDYVEGIEWLGEDLLDTPFGAAAETIREGNSPDGKVVFIEPLDAATLFPSLDADYPIGQQVRELGTKVIYFPEYSINRMYYSPKRRILDKGWGTPPPEKIYFALELMNRGDIYYANLLLDTPQAGILDLGDMEKTSAEEWVKSWRTMLTGIDPFKIPVLYEHNNKVEFIPFSQPPADIMFDKATLKYASIIASGYGMSLSDIGFSIASSGGDTLAGSIREERHTRKTGFAKLKKKFIEFFNRILPDTLEFKFIDLDDELSVSVGRARLATSTAFGQLVAMHALSPKEARLQMIADGLISISIPEDVDESEFPAMPVPGAGGGQPGQKQSNERPGSLGKPINPSQGGYGEIRSEVIEHALTNDITFRSMYENVEQAWPNIPEKSRFIILSGLQSYLHEYEERLNLLENMDLNENMKYNKETENVEEVPADKI
jgi:hypothetical protein